MEDEKDFKPEDTDTSEQGVSSLEGIEDDSNSDSDSSMSLKDLMKTELGKEYKTDAEALKALKELNSYVGDVGKVKKLAKEKGVSLDEVLKPNNASNISEELTAIKDKLWFAENSNYKPYQETILAMRKAGQNLDEIVGSNAFKVVYEKAKGYDEVENSKSVLESNPKLGLIKNKAEEVLKDMSEYNKAMYSGDATNAEKYYNRAKSNAIDAVLEAYK